MRIRLSMVAIGGIIVVSIHFMLLSGCTTKTNAAYSEAESHKDFQSFIAAFRPHGVPDTIKFYQSDSRAKDIDTSDVKIFIGGKQNYVEILDKMFGCAFPSYFFYDRTYYTNQHFSLVSFACNSIDTSDDWENAKSRYEIMLATFSGQGKLIDSLCVGGIFAQNVWLWGRIDANYNIETIELSIDTDIINYTAFFRQYKLSFQDGTFRKIKDSIMPGKYNFDTTSWLIHKVKE